jgi:hypothetical protein
MYGGWVHCVPCIKLGLGAWVVFGGVLGAPCLHGEACVERGHTCVLLTS